MPGITAPGRTAPGVAAAGVDGDVVRLVRRRGAVSSGGNAGGGVKLVVS